MLRLTKLSKRAARGTGRTKTKVLDLDQDWSFFMFESVVIKLQCARFERAHGCAYKDTSRLKKTKKHQSSENRVSLDLVSIGKAASVTLGH